MRAATVLLVVLAVVLGAATLLLLLFLLSTVADALTRPAVGAADPARQVGRLVGGAVGVGVPLALTVLTARMALAVRARRSWPARAAAVLAAVGGLLFLGVLALVAWWTLRDGVDLSGVLLATFLMVPAVVALALPVSTAVLLRRPSARAWDDDVRAGLRR